MRHYIKHIIPIFVGLAGAVACSSDRDADVLDCEQGEEMIFEVENGTRASVTNNANLTDQPFMLFGDVYRNGEFHSGLRTLFNSIKAEYKNGKWDYGAKQYWQMGQEHSFVAIHPYVSQPEISNITYTEDTETKRNSELSFTYTLPENLADAKDILIAAHRRKYTLDNADPISFKFTHILATINIMPALDEQLMYEDETDRENYPYNKDEYILFHEIQIVNIKDEAYFKFVPASLDGKKSTDEWHYPVYDPSRGSTRTLTFNYDKKPTIVTNNKEHVSIFDDKKAVIMLPQTFSADSDSAKIILKYSVNDDDPLRTITIPLKGQEWEMGKNYNYKFTIQKAYTGQIKPGSMKIEVDDPRLTDTADDAWKWDGSTIRYDF